MEEEEGPVRKRRKKVRAFVAVALLALFSCHIQLLLHCIQHSMRQFRELPCSTWRTWHTVQQQDTYAGAGISWSVPPFLLLLVLLH